MHSFGARPSAAAPDLFPSALYTPGCLLQAQTSKALLVLLCCISAVLGHVVLTVAPSALSPGSYASGQFTTTVTLGFTYSASLTPEQDSLTTYVVQCSHAAVQNPSAQVWPYTVPDYRTPRTTTLTLDARFLVPKPGDPLVLPEGLCTSIMFNPANEPSVVKSPSTPLPSFSWGPAGVSVELAPLAASPYVFTGSSTSLNLKFSVNTYYRIVGIRVTAGCGFSFGSASLRAVDLGTSLSYALTDSSLITLSGGNPDSVDALTSFTIDGITGSLSSVVNAGCFVVDATGRDGGAILSGGAGPATALFLPGSVATPTLVVSTARTQHIANIFEVDLYTRVTPPAAASSVRFVIYMSSSATCQQALFNTAAPVVAPLRVATSSIRDFTNHGCSAVIAHPQGSPAHFASTTPGRASITITCQSANLPTWIRTRISGVMSEALSVPTSCWTLEQALDATTVMRSIMRDPWIPLVPTPNVSFTATDDSRFGVMDSAALGERFYTAAQLWMRPDTKCGSNLFSNVNQIVSWYGLTGPSATNVIDSGSRVYGITGSVTDKTWGFQLTVPRSQVTSNYPPFFSLRVLRTHRARYCHTGR